MADPSLSLKQRALVSDAARALDKAKMMRFDEKSGNFYCTELGRIASHFYIHYSSVETYNEMLRRHMNDSEVSYHNIWPCAFLEVHFIIIWYFISCTSIIFTLVVPSFSGCETTEESSVY